VVGIYWQQSSPLRQLCGGSAVINCSNLLNRSGFTTFLLRTTCCLLFNSVDTVVDLGQCTLQVPAFGEALLLFSFETLELLDKIKLKLSTYPCSELKGNISII